MLKWQEAKAKLQKLDEIETQLQQVLVQNQELQAREVAAASAAAAANGSDSDVKYWRDKYHELLAETEA